MNKTNAMRQLDAAKIKYEVFEYEVDENNLAGTHVASQLGLPFDIVFKTIVARGDKSGHIVLCIPCDKEINLKKAAVATSNKKVETVHLKELLGLTGYIRGGCSPIGMKKRFPTYFDSSVLLCDKITVSAGVRGAQLLINAGELLKFLGANTADII